MGWGIDRGSVWGRRSGRGRLAALLAIAAGFTLLLATPGRAGAFTTAELDPATGAGRAVGKLYVDYPNALEKCSASVVDSANRSTILTAAHCLTSSDGSSAIGARFYPGYRNGAGPAGRWDQLQALQPLQWRGSNHRYDYAFIVLKRNASGAAVQDVAGALPIAFDQPRVQSYRVLGYPSAPSPPYDGERPWACDTAWLGDAVDLNPGPQRLQVSCDFGVGASGGPWLGAGGAVASLSSTSPVASPDIENGPYLGSEAASLYATAAGISTAPPPVAKRKRKRCKKGKRGKKRSIAAKKKKCKKKRRH